MGKAFLRLIGLAIGIAIFFLGVIWILFEGRRRGWQVPDRGDHRHRGEVA